MCRDDRIVLFGHRQGGRISYTLAHRRARCAPHASVVTLEDEGADTAHPFGALNTMAWSGSGLYAGAHTRLKPNGAHRATVDVDSDTSPGDTNHVGGGYNAGDSTSITTRLLSRRMKQAELAQEALAMGAIGGRLALLLVGHEVQGGGDVERGQRQHGP